MTTADLLKQAEDHLDRFELDECLALCQKAISQDEACVDALQLYASVLIELGQIDPAREALLKAVSASPNAGYEKFLALAQLSISTESLGYYSEAARILKEHLTSITDVEYLKTMNRQLSNIFASAAELYLTDLCFEENAEAQCEALVAESIAADTSNPESLRLQADLRLSQDRKDDAKTSILTCLGLWKDLSFDDLQYPLYEQRLAMAKVLLELELCEEATEVLEGLLEEDDSVVDSWYLLGIAQVSLKDAEGAIEALVSVLALMVRLPAEDLDQEQKESVFGLLKEIGVDAPKIWADLEEEIRAMNQ